MHSLGHIAVVFQSLHGTSPQISQRRDFADEGFRIVFFQAMVLCFPRYLLDVTYTERTVPFESNPRLFASGFPGTGCLFEKPTNL